MATIEQSVDVNVPVRTAYNQWTQFEEFPRFMEGVKEVRQLDDKRLHWRAEIAGKEKEWDAEITEQTPDQRIAWTSRSGPGNAGAVRQRDGCLARRDQAGPRGEGWRGPAPGVLSTATPPALAAIGITEGVLRQVAAPGPCRFLRRAAFFGLRDRPCARARRR